MALGDTINTSTLTLTFDDEFNTFSSSADGSTGLWRTSLMNGDRTLGGNGEQEYYSDSSVGENPFTLSNGVLNIEATPATVSNALNLPYDSGVITTENSFNQLYGYFEIDAKMPAGQGLWPAFWLLPASGAWPPELDVFEVLGNDPNTLYYTTHSGVAATNSTALSVANVSSGFNLYGVLWGPKTVELFINNVEVASVPTPADMNQPMYMLTNLAVGGYWPGNPDSSTVFPADMQVDYVRAYAYPGTTGGTVYDTTAAQNTGTAALAPVITLPTTATVPTNVTGAIKGVSFNSNWPGGFFTVQLSDTNGELSTSATSDVFTTGEDSNFLVLTGNLAPLNTALASLTYDGPGSEWVWVSVIDPQGLTSSSYIQVSGGGTVGSGTTTSTGSGTVSSGGSSSTGSGTVSSGTTPVVNTPGSFNATEGAKATVTGVSVADAQAASLTIVLSDSTGLLSTTALAGVTALGEGSTTLTLSGTQALLNQELASLGYTAGNATGADWLWVSATDPSGVQGLGHVVMNVGPRTATTSVSSGTPVVTAPATIDPEPGETVTLSGVSLNEIDPSGTITVVVSDSTGMLNASSVAGGRVTGKNATALTLSGSLSVVNAELASLAYTAGSSVGDDWVWISATTPDGTQSLGHVIMEIEAPATITSSSTPVVSAPATLAVKDGTTKALSGVSVADSGYTGTISVVLSDNTGLLKTTATSGATALGENSTALTLSGTVAEVDAALATLTYETNTTGTEWLWISAISGTTEALDAVVVTATAAVVASTAPVVKAPDNATLTTGATKAITGVSVAATGTISVMVSDSTGLLTTGTAGVTVHGEHTNAVTLSGSAAAVNADLAKLTYTAGSGTDSDYLWISANNAAGQQGLNHVVVGVFNTIIGTAGADTLTATASAQTISGGTGVDTLIGYAKFGDTFRDTMAGLNHDTIKYFGGSDLIDISNLASAKASLSYTGTATAGTLSINETGVGLVDSITLASGTNLSSALFHMSADGHGGTYFG